MREDPATRRRVLGEHYTVWPRHTLGAHLRATATRFGERPAVATAKEVVTWSELLARSEEMARTLIALGVERRDHVAVLLANDVDHIATACALWLIGAVCVPINTMLLPEELGYVLGQSNASYLVVDPAVLAWDHDQGLEVALSRASRETEVGPITVIATSELAGARPLFALREAARAVDVADVAARERLTYSPEEVADLIYTSGSTGLPKGVMITHDMLLRSGYSTAISRAFWDGRRIFTALPFYHVFALVEGLIAASYVGGELILAPRFHPGEALGMIEQHRAEDLLCVPSMLIGFLGYDQLHQHDLRSLEAVMCAAAPAPIPLWERAIRELGLTEICTGYGGTEVTAATTHTEVGDPPELVATRVGRIKPGGASGLPEFGGRICEYKTVDPFTGRDLPAGEVGELVARGPVVTRGYYRKPLETAEAIDPDGWFRSGDLGRVDERGYLELLGRSKEVFRVSAENVAPKEVEDVLNAHPAVLQSSVVGVPDPLTGEIGAAFVELRPGAEASRAELVGWCRDRLARFKVPRWVFFVGANEWPMTGTGKIQKFRLVEEAAKRLEEASR